VIAFLIRCLISEDFNLYRFRCNNLSVWNYKAFTNVATANYQAYFSTVRSEIRCALRLRYVDLIVSIEVGVELCYCFTVFSC
jgi:hypothetical protein